MFDPRAHDDLNLELTSARDSSNLSTSAQTYKTIDKSEFSSEQYGKTVYRLSALHIDLHRLNADLRKSEVYPVTQHTGVEQAIQVPTARIDAIFVATETFIDILKSRSVPAATVGDNFVFPTPVTTPVSLPHYRTHGDANTGMQTYGSPLDAAAILLVISCYLRLLEIYAAGLACFEKLLDRGTMGESHEKFLPTMSVGCYLVPHMSELNTELHLHMMLKMLRLAQEEVSRQAQAIGDCEEQSEKLESAAMALAVKGALTEATEKERNIFCSLEVLKATLK